jgi:solute carrier family 25 citrate transporter 1
MSFSKKERKPGTALLLGGICGLITESICYPFEYIKNVMQLDPRFSNSGMRHTMSQTYLRHSFKGFFRGIDCLLAMAFPRVAVRFGANEFLRKYVFIEDTMVNHFCSGVLTGMFKATIVTTPFEAIKIKLINDRMSDTPKYSNIVDCSRGIWKTEGFNGFYSGLVPTVIKIGSNLGIRF